MNLEIKEKQKEEIFKQKQRYKKIEKKIIDDETDYEPLNKIYVEITKRV